MPTLCPKCGYQRQPIDLNIHEGICPACGIAYKKWLAQTQPNSSAEHGTESHHEHIPYNEDKLLHRILEELRYVPERTDPTAFWGRAIALPLLTLWGLSFIYGGIDWESINGSFMHSINLPFHEFGHVLFRPFGRFMTILGGSLFQVLMPLGLMFAFLIQRRDTFGASLMLWWSGQSFIDLSPYIADAPYRGLPLVGGMGEEAHDWGNLLTMTNAIDSAASIARFSFTLGSLLVLTASCWGAYVLWLQYQRLEQFSG